MSFLGYLKLEFVKIKSSFIKYIIISPIILSALMNIANLSVKKEAVLSKYSNVISDGFYALIIENHLALIWPVLLLISIIITSISLFYIDLKNNLLTHILGGPIKRTKYYLAKIITIVITTTLVIIFEGILLVILNGVFNLSNSPDIGLMIRYMWFQLFSSLGVIALQGLLFSIFQDIMLLSTINIVALCGSMIFSSNVSIMKYIPYLQLAHSMPFSEPNLVLGAMLYSIIYMLGLSFIGIILFNNKDIRGE